MAKMVFRLAADKEANHIRWVEALIEIAKTKKLGKDPGVSKPELEYWVQDEDGEGESYKESAQSATEPWVKAVLEQIGNDETTNSQLLKALLSHV